jgi:hypothetical protein
MTAATQEGLRIIELRTCLSSPMQSPVNGPTSRRAQKWAICVYLSTTYVAIPVSKIFGVTRASLLTAKARAALDRVEDRPKASDHDIFSLDDHEGRRRGSAPPCCSRPAAVQARGRPRFDPRSTPGRPVDG